MTLDSFGARAGLTVGDRSYDLYRLDKVVDDPHTLPYSLRILLENLLRHEDGANVDADDIRDGIGRSVVRNLKTMARMGVFLEREVHRCYPEFPVRSGVHSWEEYLPPLHENLRGLIETYEPVAAAVAGA